eukprot:CAMPEP_0180391326 /NCGR_PEP_ID=MMETSP0989-20121125/32517_1 /TAXON_ID=697907 /ORGANISM="non described non described, Strain CCMP2293" /LENGTH=121 /DNA_ID=CAMNT_0022392857 /DNA_START=283 /DNA_END=648 /DNA_ORIENTATION=+
MMRAAMSRGSSLSTSAASRTVPRTVDTPHSPLVLILAGLRQPAVQTRRGLVNCVGVRGWFGVKAGTWRSAMMRAAMSRGSSRSASLGGPSHSQVATLAPRYKPVAPSARERARGKHFLGPT